MAIARQNTGAAALLVLVSGAPGSGKTTLATEIAHALRLFHLNRDSIWDGLRFTAARGHGEGLAHGVDVWYAALALLLESGVSLVADGTLYQDWDEAKIRPLLGLGEGRERALPSQPSHRTVSHAPPAGRDVRR